MPRECARGKGVLAWGLCAAGGKGGRERGQASVHLKDDDGGGACRRVRAPRHAPQQSRCGRAIMAGSRGHRRLAPTRRCAHHVEAMQGSGNRLFRAWPAQGQSAPMRMCTGRHARCGVRARRRPGARSPRATAGAGSRAPRPSRPSHPLHPPIQIKQFHTQSRLDVLRRGDGFGKS